MRTQLGALQNRMEHTYSAHAIQAENLTAAESRIRDLDYAEAMASYTRDQIMMQSATAMMAQANTLHRGAIQQLLAV
jgi:flagellin